MLSGKSRTSGLLLLLMLFARVLSAQTSGGLPGAGEVEGERLLDITITGRDKTGVIEPPVLDNGIEYETQPWAPALIRLFHSGDLKTGQLPEPTIVRDEWRSKTARTVFAGLSSRIHYDENGSILNRNVLYLPEYGFKVRSEEVITAADLSVLGGAGCYYKKRFPFLDIGVSVEATTGLDETARSGLIHAGFDASFNGYFTAGLNVDMYASGAGQTLYASSRNHIPVSGDFALSASADSFFCSLRGETIPWLFKTGGHYRVNKSLLVTGGLAVLAQTARFEYVFPEVLVSYAFDQGLLFHIAVRNSVENDAPAEGELFLSVPERFVSRRIETGAAFSTHNLYSRILGGYILEDSFTSGQDLLYTPVDHAFGKASVMLEFDQGCQAECSVETEYYPLTGYPVFNVSASTFYYGGPFAQLSGSLSAEIIAQSDGLVVSLQPGAALGAGRFYFALSGLITQGSFEAAAFFSVVW